MNRALEGLVTVAGAGMTVWGTASSNAVMVEVGLILVFLTMGVVPNVIRRRGNDAGRTDQ